MAVGDNLSDTQIGDARALWTDGKTLGEIAAQVGCSIYDLSPWIYRDTIRKALADAEKRVAATGEKERT